MNSSLFVKWLAFSFAIFHVVNNLFPFISHLWFAAIHFAGCGVLCVLLFHKGPHVDSDQDAKPPLWEKIIRGVLIAAIVIVPVYLMLFEDLLYERGSDFIWSDYVVSAIAILLAVELTRRTSGWFMPTLIVVSLCYLSPLGAVVTGTFASPAFNWEIVLLRSYFSEEGLFGQIAQISWTYVYMFILFGAFLLRSGAGDFIVNLAQCLAGRLIGGSGIVAVMSSGLMGSVSGSAIANTVSTGVVTIPMMNRSGFTRRFSAGVVASASTGGQLMPPVMGAGAFVLANYTGISYLHIIAVSFLPAALYFLSVAYFVRIEAKHLGIKPVTSENEVKLKDVLKQGWPFIIPLVALVGLLIYGYTPIKAAAIATVAVIVTSWLSPTPMNAKHCFEAVLDSVRTMIPTSLLLVAVGLVVMVVNGASVGNTIANLILQWADGSLVIALVLVALASLILGMGLPVVASYIVLATLGAPLLFDLITQGQLMTALSAVDIPSNVQATLALYDGDIATALREMPLNMKQIMREQLLDPALLTGMLLSAHLIIFWLSQDSNVTPPVCLAAFAAAGVAGTKPMATGLTSWKLSKGLYLVPLLFAYSPIISGVGDLSALSSFLPFVQTIEENYPQVVPWLIRIQEFLWASLGLYALAGLLHWHLDRPLNAVSAGLLAASGLLLTWAPLSAIYHFAGAIILFGVIFWQRHQNKVQPIAAPTIPAES